jgi:hypothetical protein
MYNNIMSQNILDSWEEWEDAESSNKPLNTQQHKISEERKLMEEADNELTKNLFSVTPQIKQEVKNAPLFKKSSQKPERTKEPFNKTKKVLSIKIKNRTHTQNELFGECDDNTYVKYCELEEKYLD